MLEATESFRPGSVFKCNGEGNVEFVKDADWFAGVNVEFVSATKRMGALILTDGTGLSDTFNLVLLVWVALCSVKVMFPLFVVETLG